MSFSYIRGNHERGYEVITVLEKLGGYNKFSLGGFDESSLYYLDKDNRITAASDYQDKHLIETIGNEIKLQDKPEWIPKFHIGEYVDAKYASNCYYRGSIIGINALGYKISNKDSITFSESELTKWEPNHEERVLVRNGKDKPWKEGLFSFKSESGKYFVFGGNAWDLCAPYSESKVGKVTDY